MRCAFHISKELVRRGHDVTVLTTNVLDSKALFRTCRSEYSFEGIRIRYLKNVLRFSGLYISHGLVRSLKSLVQNCDIIHLHEYRSFQNVFAHAFARQFEKPYVLTAHGSVPRVVERFLLKRLFDEAFGNRILKDSFKVLASSRIETQQYLEIGVSKEKISLIPNGIDIESFETLPSLGTFKRKFGIDNDVAMVLFTGRIHKRKGIDFLLDAFAALNDENSTLVVAGSDDGYLSVLKEKASNLRISEKVVFTGYVSESDKLAAYTDSTVVVYPGIYESFPLVPLEAALCAKPVIVADDSIMAEIVSEGGFGFSARYGDVAGLSASLRRVLQNPKLAEKMGATGRQFVSKNYSWQDIVSKIETIYESATARN